MMLRHKLLTAVAASAVMACSSAAFASDSNFQPHPYLGISAGYAMESYGSQIRDNFKGAPDHSIKENGFTTGVFLGYSFDPYVSLETGYHYLPQAKYSASADGQTGYLKLNSQDVDVLTKLNLPLEQLTPDLKGFNVYTKLGIAYVWTQAKTNMYSFSGHARSLVPVFGLGTNYDVTQNIAVGAAWQYIYGKKSTDNEVYTPSVNTFTGDLTYNFN